MSRLDNLGKAIQRRIDAMGEDVTSSVDYSCLCRALERTARFGGDPSDPSVWFSPDIREMLWFASLGDAIEIFGRKNVDEIAEYEELLSELVEQWSPVTPLHLPPALRDAKSFLESHRAELIETGTTVEPFGYDAELNYVTQLLPTTWKDEALVPDEHLGKKLIGLRPKWYVAKMQILERLATALENDEQDFGWKGIWRTLKDVLNPEDVALLRWLDDVGLPLEVTANETRRRLYLPSGGLRSLCQLCLEVVAETQIGAGRQTEEALVAAGLIKSDGEYPGTELQTGFYDALCHDREPVLFGALADYRKLKLESTRLINDLRATMGADIASFVKTQSADTPATTMSEPANQFKLLGNVWRIQYQGKELILKDRQGLRHIALLLENPGMKIPAAQLWQSSQPGINRLISTVPELEEIIKESTAAKEEKTSDSEEDPSSASDDRRPNKNRRAKRKYNDGFVLEDQEKARQNVTKNIGNAIENFQSQPELRQHLDSSITTGRSISYCPSIPTEWDVRWEARPDHPQTASPRTILRKRSATPPDRL